MENEKHEHNSPPSAFYRHLIKNTDCVLDILRFGSTALFDVGVDVDPSDNNNIVGVIRSPQPHSHLTAPLSAGILKLLYLEDFHQLA